MSFLLFVFFSSLPKAISWWRPKELFDFFIHELSARGRFFRLLAAQCSGGLRGLNNQFTCVFVCHISISSAEASCTARQLYRSTYIHLVSFISIFLLLLLLILVESFFSLVFARERNRQPEVDQNLEARNARQSQKKSKWWSRFEASRRSSRSDKRDPMNKTQSSGHATGGASAFSAVKRLTYRENINFNLRLLRRCLRN